MTDEVARDLSWDTLGIRRRTKQGVHGRIIDSSKVLSHPKLTWDREDLFDLFTCPACSGPIKEPVTLTCGYTVCMHCQSMTQGKARSNTASSGDSSISDTSALNSAAQKLEKTSSPSSASSNSTSPPPSPGTLRSRLARFFSGSPSVTTFTCPVPQCTLANHKADEALASCGITGPAAIEMLRPRIDVTLRRLKASIDLFYETSDEVVVPHEDRVYPVMNLSDENADPIMLRSKPEYAPNTSGNATPEDDEAADDPDDQLDGGLVLPSDRRSTMFPHGRARHSLRNRQSKRRRPRSDEHLATLASLDSKLRNASINESCADLIASELECQVCYLLLHEPITTPCGHSFCKGCLSRSVDHSNTCPICRFDFPGYAFFASHPTNKILENVMDMILTEQRQLRQKIIDDEFAERRDETPIFICTLAFPYMPIYLHIFEPRYRLMLRRCVAANSGFAMLLPGRDNGVNNYGTMLDIKNIKQLADGRSLVELVGNHRIRVMSRSSLDGYTVGKTERIDDISDEAEQELERLALDRNKTQPSRPTEPLNVLATEGESSTADLTEAQHTEAATATTSVQEDGASSPTDGPVVSNGLVTSATEATASAIASAAALNVPDSRPERVEEESTEELINVCRSFISSLRSGSAPWLLQRLNSTYGTEPLDNRAAFSWWMAAVIPIPEEEKARLLPIRVVRLRFKLIVFWIRQLSEQWWFTRGCTIG